MVFHDRLQIPVASYLSPHSIPFFAAEGKTGTASLRELGKQPDGGFPGSEESENFRKIARSVRKSGKFR